MSQRQPKSPRQPRRAKPKPKQPSIELTPEASAALKLFDETYQHVFLTGRAGTGKSTLLQHFRRTSRKRLAVLAPTGVAAVNVQGQTIHSFFGFAPGITIDKASRRATAKKQLYRNLQAIVIDEITRDGASVVSLPWVIAWSRLDSVRLIVRIRLPIRYHR